MAGLVFVLTCVFLVMPGASADILDALLYEVVGFRIPSLKDLFNSVKNLALYLTSTADVYTWLYMTLGPVAAYYAYKLFWKPINLISLPGTIGYIPEGGRSMKDTANEMRKRRQSVYTPPSYPNGWFGLMGTRDLGIGDCKYVHCLGLDLAVFRGEDGVAYVIDAQCPHKGANMAVGGTVVGNCLACPFHEWEFKGSDGKCSKIPYSDSKIPELAKVRSYEVLERNGMICLWFHAEGIGPTWEPPEIKEITSGKWVFRGRLEQYVNCHIEEITENAADLAHFSTVHQTNFGSHNYSLDWSANQGPEGHMNTLDLKHSLSIWGIHLPLTTFDLKGVQFGPGLFHGYFKSTLFNGVYVVSLLPEEPLMQRLLHCCYIDWKTPPILSNILFYSQAQMLEKDILVWNHKVFPRNPVYGKSHEDQMFTKFRRWYSQFYSKNSPKLSMKKDSHIDW